MYHFELKINLLFSEIELKKLIGFASEKIKKFEIVGNNLKIYIDDADDEELVKNKVNKLLKRYVLTEDKENIELIGKLPNAFNNYDDIYNLKLSITLDTFPTRIMKRSVRRQPLRRIFAALQQGEAHQWTSRSCGCSSNS